MKLCSYLTPDFYPGLKVLAHSLSARGNISGLDWIVLTQDGAPEEWADWLDGCGFNLIDTPVETVRQDKWPEWPTVKPRLQGNFQKLRILLLPAGEYLFLDTDILCMRDASGLLTAPSITACSENPVNFSPTSIAMGVVRIDANETLFDECVSVAKTMKGAHLAEQTVLNAVLANHPKMLHFLPYWWDMPTYLSTRWPDFWHPEKAVFLHFCGDKKPWSGMGENRAPHIWRKYAEGMA